MSNENERRISRRQVLATTGAVSATLVAGCSGGNGDGGTDDPDGNGTPTPTATATPTETEAETQSMDVQGSVSSKVDPLSIVEHVPRIGYFGQQERTYFPVEVTVENGGDEETDLFEYNYDVVTYDADDNDVTGSQGGKSSGGETTAPSGGRGSLIVYSTIEVDPSEVARYEVTTVCEGTVSRAEGVYCQ
jgi:hypothetical protein